MTTLLTVLLFAIWSSVFPIGKYTIQFTSPLFLTSARMLFAGLLILGFFVIFKRKAFSSLKRKHILPLGLLAVFSIYLTNALEYWGLQYLSAAKTCFIYSLTPFFAALFSYLHFKEKMTSVKWVGLLIGFIGMIPVFALQTGSEELFHAYAFFSWPTLAVMGAVLASVYGWVLLRLIVKDQDQSLSPPMANGISMLFGGAIALGHSLLIENWSPVPIAAGQTLPFIHGLLWITLISNIICYNFYGALLKRFTATFLSFVGLLSPVFAAVTSWILLKEPIPWILFFSTGIVFIGLWIVYRAELRQGYIVKASPASPEA